jgi:hypothetical protein
MDNYQPEAWPECPECEAPYILRKTIIPGDWVWQPDCKHKGHHFIESAQIVTAS